MKKFRICIIISISLLILFRAEARHIVGGAITYECLGNGDYRFTMKIYRDCYCQECADFDQIAPISIYSCSNDTECNSLTQMDPLFVLNVPINPNVDPIDAPSYPCMVLPPNICVEEGVYVFRLSDYGINLPQSDKSYHISYQRCCRNETINNIYTPDDTGATYTIEITPKAQELCNNSPVFNNFPPTVICAGVPLDFDHSASDSDGDQLVYEFCNPLNGGGPLLQQPQYSTCEGAAPNPPCPPPYDEVNFILPTYNSLQPMGGNPVVAINPNTGLITGVPTIQGQFVVGVCVSEYRNGELLSKVFRDFQFNVGDCEPTVVADLAEDEIINGQDFVVNSCGNSTVNFVNESFQQSFINEFEWGFDIGGQRQTFNTWDATVTFPGIGQYEGTLILNPGTDCGDTANIFVNVYPDVNADFMFEYDTCVAGPVEFTDLSSSGSGPLTSWNWDFGDGQVSELQNPHHSYVIPGNLPVTLTVTDTNECEASLTKPIHYFPVPALIIISPSSFLGCAPGEIIFTNLSTPIDDNYDIVWDFGDGTTGGDISPVHIYEDPGVFTVSIDITSPIGCKTDTVFPDLIKILPAPIADFLYYPNEPTNLDPTIVFTDQSSDAVSWQWDFNGVDYTFEQHPTYTFPDTGIQRIQLLVTHISGCQDTSIQFIDVIPEVRYFLPNAFTPNNDSLNEYYKGKGVLAGATDFHFSIWNRWGELIFEANNPDDGWNGRKYNTGKMSPNGVYICIAKFNGPRGEPYEIRSFVTLVR